MTMHELIVLAGTDPSDTAANALLSRTLATTGPVMTDDGLIVFLGRDGQPQSIRLGDVRPARSVAVPPQAPTLAP